MFKIEFVLKYMCFIDTAKACNIFGLTIKEKK